MELRARVVVGALATALVLACGPGEGGTAGNDTRGDPPGATGSSSAESATTDHAGDAAEPRYGIRLSTDRAVYAPGDTIRMRLEVFRRAGRPLTLSFSTAQRYDFVLRGPASADPASVRWRWSDDRFFAQSEGTVTLGEDRSTIAASVSHPAPEDPGLYRLEGRLSATDWPISAVVPVTVTP